MANILQWNCRSFLGKIDRFKVQVNKHNIDIFILPEAWLSPDKKVTFHGYDIIRQDRNTINRVRRGGGVLLGVRKNIQFFRIPLPSLLIIACVAIQAKIGDLDLSFASVYIPPEAEIELEKIKKDLEIIAFAMKTPFLILGDFNSHGYDWGCTRDDSCAPVIRDFCDNHRLIILNSGDATRVAGPSARDSAIDLSLCSMSLALETLWKVIKDPNGSDHLLIEIKITTGRRPINSIPVNYDMTRNIDWTRYNALMSVRLPSVTSIFDPLVEYKNLVDCVNAAQTREPRQIRTQNKPPTPWWTI